MSGVDAPAGPFICCGKTFRTKHALDIHRGMRHGKKALEAAAEQAAFEAELAAQREACSAKAVSAIQCVALTDAYSKRLGCMALDMYSDARAQHASGKCIHSMKQHLHGLLDVQHEFVCAALKVNPNLDSSACATLKPALHAGIDALRTVRKEEAARLAQLGSNFVQPVERELSDGSTMVDVPLVSSMARMCRGSEHLWADLQASLEQLRDNAIARSEGREVSRRDLLDGDACAQHSDTLSFLEACEKRGGAVVGGPDDPLPMYAPRPCPPAPHTALPWQTCYLGPTWNLPRASLMPCAAAGPPHGPLSHRYFLIYWDELSTNQIIGAHHHYHHLMMIYGSCLSVHPLRRNHQPYLTLLGISRAGDAADGGFKRVLGSIDEPTSIVGSLHRLRQDDAYVEFLVRMADGTLQTRRSLTLPPPPPRPLAKPKGRGSPQVAPR